VDPNPLRSVVRAALAVAASLLIAAAPAVGGAGSSRGTRAVQAAGVPRQAETRPAAPPRIVDGTRDRFDWWDAAVGAAAGLGLLLVVVGGQAAWARRGAARRAADG
jgi:hypothetical protein